MYWKSPFFFFLQITPNEALGAVISLVNFCTERWFAVAGKGSKGPPLGVTLQMNDGTTKLFTGTSEVFNWVQESSNRHGNLFCALDALERWLTLQLDAGVDITPQIDRLLAEGTSTAFIGLLANIAKYRPQLLAGPLAPILTDPCVFYWDDWRVEHAANSFDAFAWVRSGDAVFNMARDWGLAPHRSVELLHLATELITSNMDIADQLQKLIPKWRIPSDPKRSLEFRMIFAQLDRANYSPQMEADTGQEVFVFETPEALGREIKAWIAEKQTLLLYLHVPAHCEELLRKQGLVTESC